MSAEVVGWLAWCGLWVVSGSGSFLAGFWVGRARGHAEGYRRAWGLMAGRAVK